MFVTRLAIVNVDRLPPGRHGLSRELVVESQRERMFRAMAEVTAERGYANVAVADILKRAGVSRETFYEQFTNKEDCFRASYEYALDVIGQELQQAIPPPRGSDHDGPIERLDRFVGRYLAALAREPAVARAALIESYAAGPASVRRRAEGQARGAEAIAALVGARDERQRFACEAFLATVVGLVTQRIGSGHSDELSDLQTPLMDFARSSLQAVGIGKHGPPSVSFM
jgi:AcrR family transcriptional regulator